MKTSSYMMLSVAWISAFTSSLYVALWPPPTTELAPLEEVKVLRVLPHRYSDVGVLVQFPNGVRYVIPTSGPIIPLEGERAWVRKYGFVEQEKQ